MDEPEAAVPTGNRLASAKLPFPALQPERRSRPWLIVLSVAALLTSLGLISVKRPAWLLPAWADAESTEISEASLRLAIVRERQRVEAYRVRHGRLPESLEAAGGTLSGVRYVVRGDGTYLLEADLGRSYVRLASTGSVEAFLGNSLQVILNRPTG